MYIYLFQKNIQIPKYNDISSMYQIVKVRTVNKSRFLAIPKDLVEKIQVGIHGSEARRIWKANLHADFRGSLRDIGESVMGKMNRYDQAAKLSRPHRPAMNTHAMRCSL